MNKDPNVFLEHISECIDLIEDYTIELAKEDFINSVLLQDEL